MNPSLSAPKIKLALASLPGWSFRHNALTKTFQFGSFREAMSFMIRASYEAEALNHHPEWTNVYHRVSIRLTTHDARNKVTAKDVDLARRLQRISWVG